jgi:peroxiredoxin
MTTKTRPGAARTGVRTIVAAAVLLAATPCFALKEGDPFPHFTATDMAGQAVSTKDIQAQKKVVMLDFWSIYCSSCIQEMPYIVEMYKKYKDRGLQVIGIDLDVYGPARVKKFIDGLDFKIPYPTIIDAKMEIKNKLGVSMLPTVIVADTAGTVKIFHVGYKPGYEKELEEHVVKLLPAK